MQYTPLPLLAAVLLFASVADVQSQTRPPERMVRTYVPPDQLVSFSPSVPFDQFIESVNPIIQRTNDKSLIDPESRTNPINVSITGMHYFDALRLVLEQHELTYRETDRYFIVEARPAEDDMYVSSALRSRDGDRRVTAQTREIQIDAILFEVDVSKSRDYGIDWSVLFGQRLSGGTGTGGTGGTGSMGGTGGTGGTGTAVPRIFLRTDEFFDGMGDYIEGPGQVDMATLMGLFRFFEVEGLGETVANPRISVQSGEGGQIQIGSDLPIQIRDFAGNTTTQFVQTGVIVNVTPTLIRDFVADTVGAPPIEFVHLDVQVEKSGGRPMGEGAVAIDKSQANTQVLLLDGEQTVIGGLFSTDESLTRRGVPILKDLPGWFFGLRYVFGYTARRTAQKELLIVLKARVIDPLPVRAARELPRDIHQRERLELEERLEEFGTVPKILSHPKP